jgi:hypothetical protein
LGIGKVGKGNWGKVKVEKGMWGKGTWERKNGKGEQVRGWCKGGRWKEVRWTW